MEGIRCYKAWESPFKVYGLLDNIEENGFRRIPEDVAKNTSFDVHRLHTHTSGGRIRFRTDSKTVVIKINGPTFPTWHLTAMARNGADLYIDYPYGSVYTGAVKPHNNSGDCTEVINMPDGEHNVTVYLPLYGSIDSLEIGLCDGASLKAHSAAYQNELPILFYGSSITQGACASRPGRAYEALISRKYNVDYTCLGFSGACKAEDAIVEYMSTLPMCAFVSDYDHNADDPEYLKATHHKLYLKIREKNPDIPYFMITRPNFYFDENCITRRDVVMQSYLDARAAGDKNVYFIDGSAFFNGESVEDLTLDLTHPNDEGFKRMANYIGDVLAKVMKP